MHKITIQDIRILISDLRVIHAAQFNKNFPTTGDNAVPMEFVESKAMECLCDVNVDQFERARNRLLKSGGKFMPSFSDFRDWCIGETWMSADEAWARACRFTADKSVQITQITKVALDEVLPMIFDGYMKPAREQFINTYNAFVAKAQQVGRTQEMYVPPKQLEHKKKSHAPVSNDEAVQRLNALKQKLNIKNRTVLQPQKLEQKENLASPAVQEPWPDPFDQPDEYLEACERDGLNVPKTLIKHINGGTA
ncbi:hypothetical protein [Acinetobacter modestus]|uniref:Replication protein P n=1 Tax=Acinetobacter modestus TaxID=1776740 RepID=A0ABP2TXU5_9GAMM|nr:hypothetical protein [Acinetobacter modestus]ENU27046.1 hypothetical protein F992_01651 [Acinetobacter modestus]GGA17942.1 hypothetical protein GCM10017554_13430 [Acinetobacter modestus]